MPNNIFRKTIRGNTGENIKAAVFISMGLAFVCLLILKKIMNVQEIRFLTITYILTGLCWLALLYFRPMMKIDDEYLYLCPNVLRKRKTIRLREIKSVSMYTRVNKFITSSLQAKQNSTLIISLLDGSEVTLELQSLTTRVRKQVRSLLSSCNIKLDILPSTNT